MPPKPFFDDPFISHLFLETESNHFATKASNRQALFSRTYRRMKRDGEKNEISRIYSREYSHGEKVSREKFRFENWK